MERAKLYIHQSRSRYSISPEPSSRRKLKKENNPLRSGILAFCSGRGINIPEDPDHFAHASELLVSDLPKRFTLYTPMLILPANFQSHTPRWEKFLESLTKDDWMAFWKSLVEDGFRGMGVTHVAINAPISAEIEAADLVADGLPTTDAAGMERSENLMRSPSGLRPVYGEWGTRAPGEPMDSDFADAFWVEATQQKSITQVWAPLYTMFSRGNIVEKARILGVDDPESETGTVFFPGLTENELGEPVSQVDVIDFYIGIGYFAFPYLKRGIRRVWGWDINGWSIEGLKRGCQKNGWEVIIARIDQEGRLIETTEAAIVETILQGEIGEEEDVPGFVRVVAFHGDNKWAKDVMGRVEEEFQKRGMHANAPNLRHANLGLLPTADVSWEPASELVVGNSKTRGSGSSWLHIHENVDIQQIEAMRAAIVEDIGNTAPSSVVSCDSVHQVKTYAPGVMHCVFDVQIDSKG